MGREHKAALQEEIGRLGGGAKLRVFIGDGISPHYREHLEETFREARVRFVDSRREANFVFQGDAHVPFAGQVAAFFQGGRMVFEGEL